MLAAALLPWTGSAGAGPSREESLHAFLQQRFEEARENYPETAYSAAFADLDGDGRDEALVYLSSSYFCGSGGCDLYVYAFSAEGWREVAEISVGRPPIRLLETNSRGWTDLGIFVAGGGIEPHEAAVSFDGRSYQSNPTVAPARQLAPGVPGRVLISGAEPGRPLFK